MRSLPMDSWYTTNWVVTEVLVRVEAILLDAAKTCIEHTKCHSKCAQAVPEPARQNASVRSDPQACGW